MVAWLWHWLEAGLNERQWSRLETTVLSSTLGSHPHKATFPSSFTTTLSPGLCTGGPLHHEDELPQVIVLAAITVRAQQYAVSKIKNKDPLYFQIATCVLVNDRV
jgi:hypothetical protein